MDMGDEGEGEGLEGGHGTALLLVADKYSAALDIQGPSQIFHLAKLGKLASHLCTGNA